MYSIRSCMCSPESNIHYWQAPRASCPGPWCPPTSQPSSAAPSRGIGIGWALGKAFALFLSFSSFIKELPQIFTHAGSCCLKLRSFARRPYLMKCFLKQSSHLQRNHLLEEKSMTMLTTTQKCIWKSPFFWDFAHLFLRARLSRSCRSSFCSISTYQVPTRSPFWKKSTGILGRSSGIWVIVSINISSVTNVNWTFVNHLLPTFATQIGILPNWNRNHTHNSR